MSRSLYFSVTVSMSLLACGSTIDVGQNNVDGGGGGGGDSASAEDGAKSSPLRPEGRSPKGPT